MNIFKGFFQKLSRKHVIILAVCAFVVAGGVMLISLLNPGRGVDLSNYTPVYFFNAADGRLEPELIPWPGGSVSDRVMTIMNHLMNEPESSSLERFWPELDLSELVLSTRLRGYELEVIFSEAYREISPLDEALFRSALTLSLVGLPFIETVVFRVPAYDAAPEIEWVESADTIANAPSISPARISNATFTLFFLDESGDGLVTESYLAENVDILNRETIMLEKLIAGPSSPGMLAIIPPETRVQTVMENRAAGGFYVSLSNDFVARFGGNTAQARMLIASITNTLIENTDGPRTRRVFFLIDSERREEFHGVSDFHLGFTFDETAMIGYGLEEGYEDEGELED